MSLSVKITKLTKNKTMKTAIIYTRVASYENKKEALRSLKAQENECRRAIKSNRSYELAENGVYQDIGCSATDMERPGLKNMLSRAQEDTSVGAIYVKDIERLSRSVADHLTIQALLQKHGVILISVSQPGFADTPDMRFMNIVVAGVNKLQSQITSRKTTRSLMQKFNDGWWPMTAPMGYLNTHDPANKSRRVIGIDPVRAPLIAKLFKLYATGKYSLSQVREKLHEQGLRTHDGKKMPLSKLHKIVDNGRFYAGIMRWRGMEKVGNHKPIIKKNMAARCLKIKNKAQTSSH